MQGLDKQDLIILVADRNMKSSFEGLLSRNQSLGIRSISYEIYAHIHHDPGCYLECVDFLKPFISTFSHAVTVFDFDGINRDSAAPEEIEAEVEGRLRNSGWLDKAAAIVIDPELESWVWCDSPHVDTVLGWRGKIPSLKEWLKEAGYIESISIKPQHPKEALECALKRVSKPRSSSLYKQLAQRVSLSRCNDRAFNKFKGILRSWFERTPALY